MPTTLDPASLILYSPEEAHRYQADRALQQEARLGLRSPLLHRATASPPYSRPGDGSEQPSPLPHHEHAPASLEREAGTLTLRADGIAHVRIREGFWVSREDIVPFLDWLSERCPDGTPLLVDKRRPYALDFSAQQAIEKLLPCPAVAILIPALDKLPLAEYSRETYMRRVETRIFRSETHALRWLSTFLDPGPYLPAHDLIQLPDVLDLGT